MTSEFTLRVLVVGAVAYQFIIVSWLGLWLWRTGVSVPKRVEIGPETSSERKRMVVVGVLFWLAVGAIILAV